MRNGRIVLLTEPTPRMSKDDEKTKDMLKLLNLISEQKSRLVRFEFNSVSENDESISILKQTNEEILKALVDTSTAIASISSMLPEATAAVTQSR